MSDEFDFSGLKVTPEFARRHVDFVKEFDRKLGEIVERREHDELDTFLNVLALVMVEHGVRIAEELRGPGPGEIVH